jgi:hypothetical protein
MIGVVSDEILRGLPIPVWNLGATLLLAALTGVYVVLTRRVAGSTAAASHAALASVQVDLEAALTASRKWIARSSK